MRQIKFRFIVKDNEGKINLSKPYELDMEEGIPHRDNILDDMEKGCASHGVKLDDLNEDWERIKAKFKEE